MRRILFLLVLFNHASAQQSDSLLVRILQLRNDTEKVNQLYREGFALRNTDPRQAFYFANLCEDQAHISGSPRHLAKSYNLLGVLFYKKGDLTRALAYHQKALAIRDEIHDKAGAALSHTNLGNIYTDLQLFERAERSYLKALEIYRQSNDEKRSADCLINLGVLKQTLREDDAAFENYLPALKLAEKLNDNEMRSLCLNNMAQVFFNKGNYERAIAYNENALKIRQKMDNKLETADSYLNLAASYIKLSKPEKAKECLDTAYSTARYYEYYSALQMAFRIYSDHYAALGKYENAYRWLRRYELSKDSIMAEQRARESKFDFDVPETIGNSAGPEPRLRNIWLLACVLGLLIIIPLYIIRFKR